MKRSVTLALVLLVAAGLSQSMAQGTKYKVYGGLAYVAPTSDEEIDFDGIIDDLEATDELGFIVGFEYRFTKLFGLDFDIVDATHDIDFAGDTIGEVDILPISATLNFHLIRSRYFDLYLGPTVSWIDWGDVDLTEEAELVTGTDRLSTDGEFGWGATVGLDISLVKIVALVIKVRYLDVDIKPSGAGTLPVDPIIADAAIAIRWGKR